jgi:hypothetical protein
MLKQFYKGALHGLILGLLGCAVLATGMHRWLPAEAGVSASSAATAAALTHRHAQKVFPPTVAMIAGQ